MNSFLLALQFFTRIPVNCQLRFTPEEVGRSTVYVPFIGALVGFGTSFATYLFVGWFTLWPGVLLGLLVAVLLTGAFHEDGLADTADGLGGGITRERAMVIMRDSRLGTYGAVALFFGLGIRAASIGAMAQVDLERACLWIIVAAMMGRWAALALMRWMPYAREANAPAKPVVEGVTTRRLMVATLYTGFLAAALIGLPTLVPVFVLTSVGALAAAWYFHRRLHGLTGDCLGAVNQVIEIVILLLGVAWQG